MLYLKTGKLDDLRETLSMLMLGAGPRRAKGRKGLRAGSKRCEALNWDLFKAAVTVKVIQKKCPQTAMVLATVLENIVKNRNELPKLFVINRLCHGFCKKKCCQTFCFPLFSFQLHDMVQGEAVLCPLFTGQQSNKNKPNNIGGTR
jgi:hypothetical protein